MRNGLGIFAVASFCLLGCSHTPTKPGARADLVSDAQRAVQKMEADDPSLRPLIDSAVGYIVFPSAGEGGFVIGGGGGAGVVFEGGRQSGFAELDQASVGAVAGGQKFAELVIVRDRQALDDMKAGRFDFGAQASAVIVRTGGAANATFEKGVAVFIEPLSGAMVNASVGGQRIRLTL
jgi:lipid-binding SYLF domain-containing protein